MHLGHTGKREKKFRAPEKDPRLQKHILNRRDAEQRTVPPYGSLLLNFSYAQFVSGENEKDDENAKDPGIAENAEVELTWESRGGEEVREAW